jgi:hypothetical protein
MTVCGTGGGNFPQPGDPDLNNQILTAVPVYGGVQVSWSYPDINPQAVAHTLLYRSTTSVFANASELAVVSGNTYFDKAGTLEFGVIYFYWIKMVSVNGTIGDTIGPASATMSANINDLIAELTSNVDDSFLHDTLRSRIDEIDGVRNLLIVEENARTAGANAASALITQMQTDVDGVGTLINNEIITRIAGDSAVVSQVNSIGVSAGNAAAAIVTEATVRASEDAAVALTVTNLASEVGDNLATFNEQIVTQATADTAQSTLLTGLTARVGETEADISEEYTARVNADGAQATLITAAQAAGDSGVSKADAITRVVSGPDGLTSEWYVKASTQTPGGDLMLSGFGLNQSATESQFIVDADTFKVGRPGNGDDVYPFVISIVDGQSVVALNALALIPDAAITNAKIGNEIQSTIYNPYTGTGWKIDKNGSIDASEITIRDSSGNIILSSGGVLSTAIANSSVTKSSIGLGGVVNGADITGSNVAMSVFSQGAFATLSQITSAVASTYIANAAIDTAQIALLAVKTGLIDNAAITNAKIRFAAVDTLEIAGEAVTVADGVNNDSAAALTTGFQTIATKTVTFSGEAPVAVMVTGFGNFQTTSTPSSVFDIVMQITANGSAGGVVSQTHDGGTGGGTGVMASCQKYTNLTGTVVFNLQMKKNGATGTILGRNSGLIIQGVKR